MTGPRIAGSRRERPARTPMDDAVLVVGLVGDAGGYAVVVENRAGIPTDEAAEMIRMAADKIEGKDDRAAGSWGRR